LRAFSKNRCKLATIFAERGRPFHLLSSAADDRDDRRYLLQAARRDIVDEGEIGLADRRVVAPRADRYEAGAGARAEALQPGADSAELVDAERRDFRGIGD